MHAPCLDHKSSESHARATGQELADLRSVVALQVQTAALNREEAVARIHAAAAVVSQAEENVRVAKELYASGVGTSNQVLDAESLRVVEIWRTSSPRFTPSTPGCPRTGYISSFMSTRPEAGSLQGGLPRRRPLRCRSGAAAPRTISGKCSNTCGRWCKPQPVRPMMRSSWEFRRFHPVR